MLEKPTTSGCQQIASPADLISSWSDKHGLPWLSMCQARSILVRSYPNDRSMLVIALTKSNMCHSITFNITQGLNSWLECRAGRTSEMFAALAARRVLAWWALSGCHFGEINYSLHVRIPPFDPQIQWSSRSANTLLPATHISPCRPSDILAQGMC